MPAELDPYGCGADAATKSRAAAHDPPDLDRYASAEALRETGMQSRATLCSAQSQRGVGLAMESRAAKRHPPDLELHASHGAASSAARPHATLPTLIRMCCRGATQVRPGNTELVAAKQGY